MGLQNLESRSLFWESDPFLNLTNLPHIEWHQITSSVIIYCVKHHENIVNCCECTQCAKVGGPLGGKRWPSIEGCPLLTVLHTYRQFLQLCTKCTNVPLFRGLPVAQVSQWPSFDGNAHPLSNQMVPKIKTAEENTRSWYQNTGIFGKRANKEIRSCPWFYGSWKCLWSISIGGLIRKYGRKPSDMAGTECRDLYFKGWGVFSKVRTGLAVATIISSSGRAELPHHANVSKQDFPPNFKMQFNISLPLTRPWFWCICIGLEIWFCTAEFSNKMYSNPETQAQIAERFHHWGFARLPSKLKFHVRVQ